MNRCRCATRAGWQHVQRTVQVVAAARVLNIGRKVHARVRVLDANRYPLDQNMR
jgi:hypothetical protein